MGEKEEGYLSDYIAFGVIAFAIGTAIADFGGLQIFTVTFRGIDWGRTAGQYAVSGIFAYIPAAVIACYLSYQIRKTEGKTEGLTIGFMAFLVYLILTLLITICRNAISSSDLGIAMQGWALGLVFALIFYPLGGFLSGIFIAMKMPMPAFLRFKRAGMAPPPPPPGQVAQTCPTCGSPLRYIEQYQRWYCDQEKKYV
jgi:hypothetical protein